MAKTLTTAATFAEYDAWMGTRDRKKVAHNTWAERADSGASIGHGARPERGGNANHWGSA